VALTERYVSSLAVGGGDGSIGSPWTLAEADASAVAGDRVNIKADGVYTLTEVFQPGSCSNTAPIIFRGYKNEIGDGYLGWTPTGSLITTNMPSINCGTDYYLYLLSNGNLIESLNIYGNRVGSYLVVGEGYGTGVYCCKIDNSGAGTINYSGGSQSGNVSFCELLGGTSLAKGIITTVYGCKFIGSGSGTAILSSGSVFVSHCLMYGWGMGVAPSRGIVSFCTIANCVNYGVRITTNRYGSVIVGNMITGCNVGIGATGANVASVMYGNRFRDNNTDIDANMGICPDFESITLDLGDDSTDYFNSVINDYRMVKTSQGRLPDAFMWNDVGAMRADDALSSGTGIIGLS